MRLHLSSGVQSDLLSSTAARHIPDELVARGLFEGGPPTQLQTRLRLMRPDRLNIRLRIALAITIGWVPLFLLTGLQSAMRGDASLHALLTDYAVYGRTLIAVPLLILAEKFCLPRLGSIAWHIRQTTLLREEDVGTFDQIVKSTLRLRDSMRLELAVVVLAVVIVATLFVRAPVNIFPAWHQLNGKGSVSPAGWWHTLVSVPLLAVLLLGWSWRLTLWVSFLWRVSRLDLQLLPAHPDRAGGLKFLGASLQAFAILACAIGTIVAGAVTNRVVHDHAALLSFRYLILGFDVLCLIIFVGPLFFFTPHLMNSWREGSQEYGALARRIGQEMERKWLNRPLTAEVLEANDFSATTDFYSIAANVYTINLVPIGIRELLVLAVGGILPFMPILLLAVPPQEVLRKLLGLLF
jgi:ABC-type multidrug transport system fused ATPase/permease subunit